jgi:hypothetical protein
MPESLIRSVDRHGYSSLVKLKSIRLWYRRLVLLRFFVMPFDIVIPSQGAFSTAFKTRKRIANYDGPGHFPFRGAAVYATPGIQANPIATLFIFPLWD